MESKKSIWKAKIVVAYDGPFGKQGEVLSRHKSYNAAEKFAKRAYPGDTRNWVNLRLIDEMWG